MSCDEFLDVGGEFDSVVVVVVGSIIGALTAGGEGNDECGGSGKIDAGMSGDGGYWAIFWEVLRLVMPCSSSVVPASGLMVAELIMLGSV
jgi:hypothetical protein